MRKTISAAGHTTFAQPPVLDIADGTGGVTSVEGKWIGPVRHAQLAQEYTDLIRDMAQGVESDFELMLRSERHVPRLLAWALTYLTEMGFPRDLLEALPDNAIGDAALGFFVPALLHRDPAKQWLVSGASQFLTSGTSPSLDADAPTETETTTS